MKKILSLVLAVAMLSTVAFAGTVEVGPGTSNSNATADVGANPGDTIRFFGNSFVSSVAGGNALLANDYHFSSEYLTLSTKTFEKGANLVKEVKFNDDKLSIDIVLNSDYTKSAPNGANVVIKKLAVKAKSNYDKSGATPPVYNNEAGDLKKGTEYVLNTDAASKSFKVGYSKVEQYLDGSASPTTTAGTPCYMDGKLVTFTAKNGVSYETVSLDTAADIYIEGRVYDGDKVYVEVNNDADKEILKASDENADIRFYNVVTNGLPTANTVQITAEEDEFVYKIVDGKIAPSGLKWSSDDYAWVGKIRASVSYVVSDIELKVGASAEGGATAGTDNPDTGANDVVGIAAALAVVSLVAAGAVSLKK